MSSVKRNRNLASLLAVLFIASAVAAVGCNQGDGGGEGGNDGFGWFAPTPADLIAAVGMQVCTTCHPTDVPNTPGPYATEWLSGQHGNLNAFDATDGTLDSMGFPSYAFFGGDPTCAGCHDPLSDGLDLEPNLTGNVPRPVVSCEACHGGGAEHFGVGNIPYPKPPAERCGLCHNAAFPDSHDAHHPNGGNIYEDYAGSPHSLSTSGPESLIPGTEMPSICSRCHTDEGFRQWVRLTPNTMSFWDMNDYFAVIGDPLKSGLSGVSCRTCHSGHMATADQLTAVGPSVIAGETQTSQFNTCTSCHLLVNDTGAVQNGPAHGNPQLIITDTHAAVPGDTRGNWKDLGCGQVPDRDLYFIQKGDASSCARCHNPHAVDNTINEQYARSGHGDRGADPWIHYDWKLASRQSCQRCHSTTGFVNFANDPATYNPVNNNFSHLLPNQTETLYCYGCHAARRDTSDPPDGIIDETSISYSGEMRDPGPVTAPYKEMDGSTIIFPDLSGSNVCLSCHSAREGGGTIQASAGDFANLSFINSHYLAAGAVVFRTGGYEYAGRDYTNVAFYEHDLIGLPAAGATVTAITGANGPCVGCHMHGSPEPHLFLPTEENGDTLIPISASCAACHNGAHALTSAELTESREELHASLEALYLALAARSIFFAPGHPYFFNVACEVVPACGVDDPGITNCASAIGVKNWSQGGTAQDGKYTMGAAFNYNLIEHDPGAFAHNRYYIKRLLYDSIDWLDNHALDDSVAATLPTLGLTPEDLALAQGYVLSGMGARP